MTPLGTLLRVAAGLVACAFACPPTLRAQESPDSLMGLSLEQLMELEVESVSRREERLFDAPASVYVITAEDLRRSAARTLPEALRMVPGLHVAQVNADQWAVGSRGRAAVYNNSLLVLIDGRTVYSRLFGGVFWEEEDIPLSEVERIEVVKGPGATLWGSNAVNGVINIVTKRARRDDGTLVKAQPGSHRQEFGLSHSAGLGDAAAVRVFANYKKISELETRQGLPGADGSWLMRAGARLDWENAGSSFTLSGGVFDSKLGSLVTVPVPQPPFASLQPSISENHGGHVLARYRRTLAGGSALTVQGYYDDVARPGNQLDETERTLDLEAQHDVRLGERNRLVWGVGYRHVVEEGLPGFQFALDPTRYVEDVVNAFAQDEFALVPDRLWVTLGAKIERTGYTGWEFQPKGSVLLRPSESQTLWASVSRAVRVPTRVDRAAKFNIAIFPTQTGVLTYLSLAGGDMDVERLTAFEAGYRIRPEARVSFDLSVFLNRYDDLRVFVAGAPEFVPVPPPGSLHIRSRATNGGEGDIVGGEFVARVEPLKGWVVEGSYTHLEDHLKLAPGVPESATGLADGRAPKHQVRVRSVSGLPGRFELDALVRYASELESLGVDGGIALDAALTWQPRRGTEFALGALNVFANEKVWYVSESSSSSSLIPTSFFASIAIRF